MQRTRPEDLTTLDIIPAFPLCCPDFAAGNDSGPASEAPWQGVTTPMEATLSGLTTLTMALLQMPGMEGPDMTATEWLVDTWEGGGWMMYPLATALGIGIIIIIWKLIDLTIKSSRTKAVLGEVDERLTAHDVQGAMDVARESNAPAARILLAGLERHGEGTERVMKAIENVGLIEMAGLESGLVWLATIANVAPLLGFLGTVIGMIQAFQAIEMAGEVEATLVAGGI
ncbi:MAG: MotA/TolQ/ExbB proton channel family protein, partial [Actinobacteria bacterium]|nr:MotA/TolQ/ExbB proton channel family protein [Gemmatimonadota bacterium]NIU21401.1 MotA/TolQ/ExbB proton channel family protein [Actinomycetota bacterium]NIX47130.1 hypothetical protein [Gemmatimonadota bacterium]NIY11509.1 hypothetical protein [Gemmatimonadota bacterium]